MPNENDTDIVQALRLSIEWKSFQQFCISRTSCKGCVYRKDHICSMTCSDKILAKIAEAARRYFVEQGITM